MDCSLPQRSLQLPDPVAGEQKQPGFSQGLQTSANLPAQTSLSLVSAAQLNILSLQLGKRLKHHSFTHKYLLTPY